MTFVQEAAQRAEKHLLWLAGPGRPGWWRGTGGDRPAQAASPVQHCKSRAGQPEATGETPADRKAEAFILPKCLLASRRSQLDPNLSHSWTGDPLSPSAAARLCLSREQSRLPCLLSTYCMLAAGPDPGAREGQEDWSAGVGEPLSCCQCFLPPLSPLWLAGFPGVKQDKGSDAMGPGGTGRSQRRTPGLPDTWLLTLVPICGQRGPRGQKRRRLEALLGFFCSHPREAWRLRWRGGVSRGPWEETRRGGP